MRKENKKMLAGLLSAVCVISAGLEGNVSAASTETRKAGSIEETQTISSALASALEQIPEVAAVAVSTQEWFQKAVANIDGEIDVRAAGEEGSEVVGKLYHNTIVDIEEKGVVWTKISAGEVNGYVKSDSLAFGTDAVKRADQVCPVVEKVPEGSQEAVRVRESAPAKTIAQIEEEKAAAEAQAAEEARKAEEDRKEEEARKQAEEAEAQAQQQATQAAQQTVTAANGEQALLAALIFCEAGGEPYEGQVAVGAVVMNRVRSGIFPNSITEVIYQSGQFGTAITGLLDAVLADGRTTASCYQAAADALAGAESDRGCTLLWKR